VDDAITSHYLFDDSRETHPYALIRALQERWIQIDARGQPFVSLTDLPRAAQDLWHAFWRAYNPDDRRPRGFARHIEKQFMQMTGTTPIDLQDNAEELLYFLERGYRVEQLFR
jgi:hypothetical protein